MVRKTLVMVITLLILSTASARIHAENSTPSAMQPRAYIPLILRPANSFAPSDFEQQVIDLVNQERAAVGCPALTTSYQLMNSARSHSSDMALNDIFSHRGSDGSTVEQRINATGYTWNTYGENIAAGYSTAQSVFDSWMSSADHRSNILNCAFREIGVGYYNQANDQNNVRLDDGTLIGPFYHYWTQVFATSR